MARLKYLSAIASFLVLATALAACSRSVPATKNPTPSTPSMPAAVSLPAVKVDANGFWVEGQPFTFVGANQIQLGQFAFYGLSIEDVFRSAKENGINVIRIYLDYNAPGGNDLSFYDSVLDIASRNGVYILATMTDCC